VAILKNVSRAIKCNRADRAGAGRGPLWVRSAVVGCLILLTPTPSLWMGSTLPASPSGTPGVSEAAAQSLAAKIKLLSDSNPDLPLPWPPVVITEIEANSYLKYRGHEFLPAGVKNLEIQIVPDQLSGSVDVDFDELGQFGAQTDDWGARVLALLFKGKQRVSASGKLETRDGHGKLTIVSMTLGGLAIPAGFVNFLVQDYFQRRYQIDLSKPFGLPDQVTHIALAAGHATLYRAPSTRR